MPRVKGRPRGFTASHATGSDGRPSVGTSYGTGFSVTWPSAVRPGQPGGVRNDQQVERVAVLCDVAADRLVYLTSIGLGGAGMAAAMAHLSEAGRALRRAGMDAKSSR